MNNVQVVDADSILAEENLDVRQEKENYMFNIIAKHYTKICYILSF